MTDPGERPTPSPWSSGPLVDSEASCLALIDEIFPSRSPHVPLGRGDDCAELLVAAPLALSTDIFAQDTHFRTSYFSPAEVGGKALTTAISDLAAAGANPLGFSLGLTLPPGLRKNALRDLLTGMRRVADTYGLSLSGGDISRGEKIHLCLTVWGNSVAPDENSFLRRGAAQPGDAVFCIGALGLARAGLLLLERHGRAVCAAHPAVCAAHLDPVALVKQGQALTRLVWERERRSDAGNTPDIPRVGLMDVSDGLARDLPRLLSNAYGPEKALGADLLIPESLIRPELRAAAEELRIDPLELLLAGGEDYALLGICEPAFWPLLQKNIPDACHIGQVVRRPGISCNKAPLTCAGFDHFAREIPDPGPSVPDPPDAGIDISTSSAYVSAAADIREVCFRAWQRGLLAGFNGNASRRLTVKDEPTCLITRSGAAKSALTADDFAVLSQHDGILLAGASPSSEAAMHLAVYRNCPEAQAILHCHPPCLLALSLSTDSAEGGEQLSGAMLNLPLFEAETYRTKLGHVAALAPGSQDLADAVGQEAERHPAVWMSGHGLMVRGHSLGEALALAEELEQLARIQLLSR